MTWPLLWCVYPQPAEGMLIDPEQETVFLAEGDAESPQRALDTRPLGEAQRQGGPEGSGVHAWHNIGDHI